MSDAKPYLIESLEAAGRALTPLPSKDNAFQEDWLQEMIFLHPSILPVDELDKEYASPIALGREIAGIDDLLISPSGLLTIVETKLWRNPEAHRTVVAQILDYTNTLKNWSYTKLDEAVRTYTAKRFGQARSIYQIVKDGAHNLDMSEIEFQARVQDGLTNGRFALLIVGDRIYASATQLADIIQSAPHLQFCLGFVELRCYRLKTDSPWPLVVVPRIVSRTNEVTRAVVKIIYEQKKPDVQVTSVDEDKPQRGSTSLSEFTASLPSSISELFRLYLDRWIKEGRIIFWGKVGFSLRILWKGKPTTVLDAYPDSASVFQDKRVKENGLPMEDYQQYRATLMTSATLGNLLTTGKRYIAFDAISEAEVRLLLENTDRLVQAWSKAEKSASSASK